MTDQQNQLLENWEKDFRADLKIMFRNKEKPHDIENAIVYVMQGLIRLQEAKTREEERSRACKILLDQIQQAKEDMMDLDISAVDYLEEAQQQILDLNEKKDG